MIKTLYVLVSANEVTAELTEKCHQKMMSRVKVLPDGNRILKFSPGRTPVELLGKNIKTHQQMRNYLSQFTDEDWAPLFGG